MPTGFLLDNRIKNRIKKLNEETSLSQYEIAGILNISQCSVSKTLKEMKKEKDENSSFIRPTLAIEKSSSEIR